MTNPPEFKLDGWRVIIAGEYQYFDTEEVAKLARAEYDGPGEPAGHVPEPFYVRAASPSPPSEPDGGGHKELRTLEEVETAFVSGLSVERQGPGRAEWWPFIPALPGYVEHLMAEGNRFRATALATRPAAPDGEWLNDPCPSCGSHTMHTKGCVRCDYQPAARLAPVALSEKYELVGWMDQVALDRIAKFGAGTVDTERLPGDFAVYRRLTTNEPKGVSP